MARKFSAAFKFEVVRQLQSDEKRLAQVCREHDLDPAMVRGRRERVEKRGSDAFPRSPGAEDVPATTPATLAAAEARIGDLERLVGQLTWRTTFEKRLGDVRARSPRKVRAHELGSPGAVAGADLCPARPLPPSLL